VKKNVQNDLAVSVLDLVSMRPGEPAGSAIARSVDLAQHVESWGYQRYWLAEHHSIAGVASSATSVLIGHIAGATKTIRVGSGGVMLPNHAPLVIAEQFGTLEAMHPGRIDLGLGRAPGGDFQTMRALRRDLAQTGDDFPDPFAGRYLHRVRFKRRRVSSSIFFGTSPTAWSSKAMVCSTARTFSEALARGACSASSCQYPSFPGGTGRSHSKPGNKGGTQ
jgi:luciferase family oxidoreductase group 1